MHSPIPRRYRLAAAFCCLAGAAPAGAAIVDAVLIDEFIVPQTVNVTAPATAIGFDASSAPGITSIGGERELYVRKTYGAQDERTRSRVNPNGQNLWRMTNDASRGLVQIIYDGIDGGPPPDRHQLPDHQL